MSDKDKNECYPCSGLGYHIETCIEADGSRNRVKLTCACCDGSGQSRSKELHYNKSMNHSAVFTQEQLELFEANLIKDLETNKDLKPVTDERCEPSN